MVRLLSEVKKWKKGFHILEKDSCNNSGNIMKDHKSIGFSREEEEKMICSRPVSEINKEGTNAYRSCHMIASPGIH